MRSVLLVVCAALGSLASGGCNPYGEILAKHVEPGGVVQLSLDGAMYQSKGIVTAKTEPLTVTATSPVMTFGLSAVDITDGRTALGALNAPSTSAQIDIGTGSSAVQVHAGGKSCVIQTGMLTLNIDGNDNMSGSFDLTGTYADGTACQVTGTFSAVPVDRG